jgi:hypothetical protein
MVVVECPGPLYGVHDGKHDDCNKEEETDLLTESIFSVPVA